LWRIIPFLIHGFPWDACWFQWPGFRLKNPLVSIRGAATRSCAPSSTNPPSIASRGSLSSPSRYLFPCFYAESKTMGEKFQPYFCEQNPDSIFSKFVMLLSYVKWQCSWIDAQACLFPSSVIIMISPNFTIIAYTQLCFVVIGFEKNGVLGRN